MAGVRKLKELSARRHSNVLAHDHSLYDDDDSRPFCPDKQLKNYASCSTKAVAGACARHLPDGLGLTGILPKHYLQPLSDSRGSKKSNKAPTVVTSLKKTASSSSSSAHIRTRAQPHRTSAAATKPAVTALPRSQNVPSRDNRGSSIGAAGLLRKPALTAPDAVKPAYSVTAPASAHTRGKCSRSNSAEWQSSSNSSSRASSRGATPAASPAPGVAVGTLHKSKKPQQVGQNANRRSETQDSAHSCDAIGGSFVPPYRADVQPAVQMAPGAVQPDPTAAAAAALEAGAGAAVKELIKLQVLQQQRWQQQHMSLEQPQPERQALDTSNEQKFAAVEFVSTDVQQQHPVATEQAVPADALFTCSSQDAVLASLTSLEFEEVSRDVAARIIQAHWRWWRENKPHQLLQQQLNQQQQTKQQEQSQQQADELQQLELLQQQHNWQLGPEASLQLGKKLVMHGNYDTAAMGQDAAGASVDGQQQQCDTQDQDAVAQNKGTCEIIGDDGDHAWLDSEQQHQQQSEFDAQPQQQEEEQRQEQGLLQQQDIGLPQLAYDALQQLLGQLQLDADAIAVLNGDSQLRALLAAALAQPQAAAQQQQHRQPVRLNVEPSGIQQQEEECYSKDSGSVSSHGGSCTEEQYVHSSIQHAEPYEVVPGGDNVHQEPTEHQRNYQDGSAVDVTNGQIVGQINATQQTAAHCTADSNAAGQSSGIAAVVDPNSGAGKCETSPIKPAALDRLRRSMEGRQAVKLQHLRAGKPVEPVALQAAEATSPATGGSAYAVYAVSGSSNALRPRSASTAAGASQNGVAASDSRATAARPQSACASSSCAAGNSSVGAAGVGRSSMTAEKLGTIMAYLDAVDAEAEEEAAAALGVGLPQPLELSREASQAMIMPAGSVSGSSTSRAGRHISRSSSRAAATVAAAALVSHLPSGRQALAGSRTPPSSEASLGLGFSASTAQHSQAALGARPAAASRQQPPMACHAHQQQQQQQALQQQQLSAGNSAADLHVHVTGGGLLGEPSAAVSVGCYSMVSQGNRSAVLAESVFDGVRAKMSRIKAQLAEKERAAEALQQELLDARQHHSEQLAQLAHVHEQEMAAAASDSSAAVSRHLAFIDRLMEDKQQLNRQLAEQRAAVKAAEDKNAAAIAALKAGWTTELKKQQAMWEAGAAAKQETWRAAKAAEIKEQTIKGLEVEVQRMISRHRAELAATLDKAGEQSKAAVEAAKVQHEAAMAALQDRLRQEHEDGLERERAAAASRLREASERYEAQMQAARLRLIADADLKLEAATAAAKEERKKSEAALAEAAAAARQHEAQLKDQWAREKEALERVHARALDAAKAAAQDERSAWRAAVTEKIKRQAAEREDQLRSMLIAERDAELQEVIARLEEEQAAALEATKKKIAADHAAITADLQAQLKEAQRGTARLGDKARSAAQAVAAAEQQRDDTAAEVDRLRHELQLRDQQLAASRLTLSAKEAEGCAAAAAAGAAATTALTELAADKAQLEARVATLQQQLHQAQQQHEAEMVHVECRVKGVIAKKDKAIMQLQQQLSAAVEQMRGTEAVLAAQQAELFD